MSDQWVLFRGRRPICEGTKNECLIKLQRVQGQSWDYALKHGGYRLLPARALRPSAYKTPRGMDAQGFRYNRSRKMRRKRNPVEGDTPFERQVDCEQKLEQLERDAKRLVMKGATPAFHLGPAVGPHAYLVVETYEEKAVKWAKRNDIDIDDWGNNELQFVGISIDVWAEAVDLTEPYLLFLAANGPIGDMHNAFCSAVGVGSRYEFDQYLENCHHQDSQLTDRQLKWAWANGYISPADLGHEDYYYYWEMRDCEEKVEMAERLLEAWYEAIQGQGHLFKD